MVKTGVSKKTINMFSNKRAHSHCETSKSYSCLKYLLFCSFIYGRMLT